MSRTRVVVYCEEDGLSPFVDWFGKLPEYARDKVIVRLERLAELDHELRRPEANYLRDGIYELSRDRARRALPCTVLFPRSHRGRCRARYC